MSHLSFFFNKILPPLLCLYMYPLYRAYLQYLKILSHSTGLSFDASYGLPCSSLNNYN